MKRSILVALSGAGLAVALGGSAWASSPAQQPSHSPVTGQERIAETTLKLEKAFSDQFANGQIDRSALAPLVSDVVQAMPEAARPKVQSHIDEVLASGEAAATKMSPEERAQAAAPAAAEKVGKTQAAWVGAFGWPSYAGFGGIGAFGFPGMFANCVPYGGGYAVPYVGLGTIGYSAGNYSAYSCGTGYGYGLGTPGWYW